MPRVASVEIWEQESAREVSDGKDGSYRTRYTVTGTNSEAVALAMLADTADPSWNDYYFLEASAGKQVGPNTWEFDVTYGKEAKPDEKSQDSDDPNDGSWKLTWDTTGGTQHITQSLETTDSGANLSLMPNGVPNFGGAIGVSDSGVAGCDIVVPKFTWQETRQIPRLIAMTFTYLHDIYKLVGTTNDAIFRGFPIGTVLFMGARGDVSAKDPRFVEITFQFAASQNMVNVVIGKGGAGNGYGGGAECQPVDKKGWEYLWVLYHEKVDETAKYKVKQPACVFVEQVYWAGDFSKLLIGT